MSFFEGSRGASRRAPASVTHGLERVKPSRLCTGHPALGVYDDDSVYFARFSFSRPTIAWLTLFLGLSLALALPRFFSRPTDVSGTVALPLAVTVQAVPTLAPAPEKMPACHVAYPWRGALYPVM